MKFRTTTARTAACSSAILQQCRCVRYGSIQETLRPTPGQSAGQMSILSDICCNPDAEEERRKPAFRHEVAPKVTGQGKVDYLRRMYQWGFDSLTLFKKTNEDPGPWWNANSSTLVSNFSQIGDNAGAGMWSGVWRYTYGTGEYNLRPYQLRGRAWAHKERKHGCISVPYASSPHPLARYVFPHTAEHAQHRRMKNPHNEGFKEINALHGKRILREVQYHLGQGIRFYLVDGVFGSYPATATPYRIITDNPTHAYFVSLAAIRAFNFVSQQEIMLVKRVTQSPLDEWGWRRPGVLIYHTPCYDFEIPRIVEEFGGPRPKDLSLDHNRFLVVEPYSIPMKAMLGGEPSCDALLDATAFLCARWGFYADDKGFLTVRGESILHPDENRLTLVITNDEKEADKLRASPHLYGSRHHRVANGIVSRAWDVTSAPQGMVPIHRNDIVEPNLRRVQKSLPTRMGLAESLSHRQYGRRQVSEFGFKSPHHYTQDAASKAYAGGHLFKEPSANELAGHKVRPSHIPSSNVDVLVVGEGNNPEKVVMNGLRQAACLYAEEDKLAAALSDAFKQMRSVKVVSPASAKASLESLVKNGTA